MDCPDCSSTDTRVVDTRQDVGAVRRRRRCECCGARFTTYERAAASDIEKIVVDFIRGLDTTEELTAT